MMPPGEPSTAAGLCSRWSATVTSSGSGFSTSRRRVPSTDNPVATSRFRLLWSATVALALALTAGAATAQQRLSPSQELITYYYKDPRPERLVGYFGTFGELAAAARPHSYVPITGFFAVVFRDSPEWIDRLVPADLNPLNAEALFVALQLSGHGAQAEQVRTKVRDTDAKLTAELAGLPARLEDLHIATPTHLDLLWGASFASGDGRYARMIIDYFAETANRSEPIAIHIAQAALAQMRGRKEVIQELRQKYDDETFRQIMYASAALWALQSNAKQHAFVDEVVARYIAEHPDTPATKALSAFRQSKRN